MYERSMGDMNEDWNWVCLLYPRMYLSRGGVNEGNVAGEEYLYSQ